MRPNILFIPGYVQRTGLHYLNECLLCTAAVCVTFVAFTDCESCTWPILKHLESSQAGELGLSRGAWFASSRFELVAVALLLWSWERRCYDYRHMYDVCFECWKCY